ncbi:MAG: sialate O-acetylesterase [Chitinophagaceae bacterium BSSC1]|nr:MAG: sialate O-acetylesterase [Chitinophagaceae bacterium BSSC1]
MFRPILFLLFFLITQSGFSQLSVAKIFNHHMVLQRGQEIPVWGSAPIGKTVTIRLNQSIQKAQVDAKGNWKVIFPMMQAGGPYQMTIATEQQQLDFSDIMIGEVWVCSGQSNMDWTLKDAFKFREERAGQPVPDIRQFYVPREVALKPNSDLSNGKWDLAHPDQLGDFTAVGYFFAKELWQKLHVTIGLVNASWGGSQIEGWISQDAMKSSSQLSNYASSYPNTWDQADTMLLQQLKKSLSQKSGKLPSTALVDILTTDSTQFQSWLKYAPPSQWDWQGIWAYRGAGFMQRVIDVNTVEQSKASTLSLGENDGAFELYLNGQLFKKGEGRADRLIQIPAGTWKTGKNILLLHQAAQKDPAWFGNGFYGEGSKLYLKFDYEPISLAGEGWRMMPDFSMPWHYVHSQNNAGSVIYNGMIHPLIPFAIKGVLWYQGESNAGRAFQYRSSFPLLINSWRKDWKYDFPFYFVQLSSFGKFPNSNQGSEWAELREAQLMALQLPNTGMAVTTDIGNPDNIHPKNKADVGTRLAAIALAKNYGIEMPYSGPVFQQVQFKADKAILSFKHINGGLVAKDAYGYLKGFEIAGEDKQFHFAQASIEGDQVIVCSKSVKQPIAVRYGWTDAPIDANLFNKAGFPATPFRTDKWKGLTDAKIFE